MASDWSIKDYSGIRNYMLFVTIAHKIKACTLIAWNPLQSLHCIYLQTVPCRSADPLKNSNSYKKTTETLSSFYQNDWLDWTGLDWMM